jgi:hypothetical protein
MGLHISLFILKFLNFLSFFYLLKFIIRFIIKIFLSDFTPIKIEKLEVILILISLSYFITYLTT